MIRLTAAVVLLSVVTLAGFDQSLQVVPLPRDGEVLVSFKLGEALTDDVRAAIHSGMTISFVYKVDLRRSAAAWFDRTIASSVVTATVRYDNLTRKYHVTRLIDGQMDVADKIDREDAAWAWLTRQFDRLALFRTVALEPNGEYYVRVRAHTTPRNASFVWPWQREEVVGLAKFTFVR